MADRQAVDTTPEGERVRRYQLDCDRKLRRAIQGLLKLRRGEGIGVADDPAPDGVPGSESEGTIGVRSGPVGEADPAFDSGSGISYPSLSIRIPGSPLPDFDVAEPVWAVVAALAGPAARPGGGLVPQHEHEPTTPAAAERTAPNEPIYGRGSVKRGGADFVIGSSRTSPLAVGFGRSGLPNRLADDPGVPPAHIP